MRNKEFSEQIVLRVPPPLREEIERKASAESRSLANMARRILERALAFQAHEAA